MSLKNQHIIIFSLIKFDGPLESTTFTMAKYLAKDNYVYFVDRPVTFKELFTLRNTEQLKRRRPHFFSAKNNFIQTEIPNLKVIITPPVPSINKLPEGWLYRLAVKANERIVANRLIKVIKQLSIDKFIFINSFNFFYPNIHQLIKPQLTVYQCLDPLVREYELRHGLISEPIIVKQADLIICTSKALYQKQKNINNNTFFIANAANITDSQKALDNDLPVAAILSGIKRPIIGYFGNIERRIDYPLLKALLKHNPDKSFVLAGPVLKEYFDIDEHEFSNLYLTGAIPYEQMPSILKGFDVAIIPFKKDEVSNTIFPLKLFEYLGSGKPMVSTNFNDDLKDFTGDTVSYCKDAVEFSAAIEAALNDTPEQQQKRLTIARENTWEHRIRQIEDLISVNLKEKENKAL